MRNQRALSGLPSPAVELQKEKEIVIIIWREEQPERDMRMILKSLSSASWEIIYVCKASRWL